MRGQMNLEQLLRAATALSDEEAVRLWDQFRENGDRAAFDRLFAWFRVPLSRCLCWLLRDEQLAEDVFQEVMITVLRCQHCGKIPHLENPRAWMWRITVNVAKDWHRSENRRELRERKKAMVPTETSDRTEQVIDRLAIRQALELLSEDDRELISLKYFDGLTQKEAASVLECDPGTLKDRLDAALERLGRFLATAGVATTIGIRELDAAVLPISASLPPERLSRLLDEAWRSAATSWSDWSKAVMMACAVLLTGGGVLGGWTVLQEREPKPLPQVPTKKISPSAQSDVEARNRLLLKTEVLPKALAALQTLVPEGTVKVKGKPAAFQTRVRVQFELRQHPNSTNAWQIKIDHEAASKASEIAYDFRGDGVFHELNPEQPIVIELPFGKKLTLGAQPFRNLVAAFRELPSDPIVHAEFESHVQRWEAAVKSILGTWYIAGDSARRVVIEMDHRNLMIRDHRGHTWITYARWAQTSGDRIVFECKEQQVLLSPDGQRLLFVQTGAWWSRKPGV